MKKMAYLMVAMLFVSCATTKFDKKEISRIKTVAVVGHLVTQTHLMDTADVKKNVKEGLLGAAAAFAGFGGSSTSQEERMMQKRMPAKFSTHSVAIYNNFVKQLNADTTWKVLSVNDLKKNKAYNKAFEKMERKYAYVNSMGDEKKRRFKTKTNFHPRTVTLMSYENREALFAALGVDAIVSIDYNVGLTRAEMLATEVKATTLAKLYVFKKGVADPIITKDYKGTPTIDGKAKVGFIGYADDKKIINNLIINSTISSNDLIIKDLTTL